MILHPRMSYEDFKKLLNCIEQHIPSYQVNGGNKDITAPERLVLTLRFLVTGESFKSLSFQFCKSKCWGCMSKNKISPLIKGNKIKILSYY